MAFYATQAAEDHRDDWGDAKSDAEVLKRKPQSTSPPLRTDFSQSSSFAEQKQKKTMKRMQKKRKTKMMIHRRRQLPLALKETLAEAKPAATPAERSPEEKITSSSTNPPEPTMIHTLGHTNDEWDSSGSAVLNLPPDDEVAWNDNLMKNPPQHFASLLLEKEETQKQEHIPPAKQKQEPEPAKKPGSKNIVGLELTQEKNVLEHLKLNTHDQCPVRSEFGGGRVGCAFCSCGVFEYCFPKYAAGSAVGSGAEAVNIGQCQPAIWVMVMQSFLLFGLAFLMIICVRKFCGEEEDDDVKQSVVQNFYQNEKPNSSDDELGPNALR